MSEVPDIYLTRQLTKDQLQQAIAVLPEFIRNHFGNCIVQAEYGWGCNLHPALCYRKMEVGISWLDRFISDSLRQEIVVLGNSDFMFSIPDNRLTVLFCHEGDIHARGTDMEVQKALWSCDPFQEYPLAKAPHLPEPPKPKQPWF
jgi:hypothetical protein